MAIAVLSQQETKSRLAIFKLTSCILSNDGQMKSPGRFWATEALRTEGGVSGVRGITFHPICENHLRLTAAVPTSLPHSGAKDHRVP
jgi:hypothetical protein